MDGRTSFFPWDLFKAVDTAIHDLAKQKRKNEPDIEVTLGFLIIYESGTAQHSLVQWCTTPHS